MVVVAGGARRGGGSAGGSQGASTAVPVVAEAFGVGGCLLGAGVGAGDGVGVLGGRDFGVAAVAEARHQAGFAGWRGGGAGAGHGG